MGSKAESLRAMREAQAQGAIPTPEVTTEPEKKRVTNPKPKTGKRTSKAPKAAKGHKNGDFIPNKTKGRPHKDKAHLTNEAGKPWEAMKVSRRTWYRKMAKGNAV